MAEFKTITLSKADLKSTFAKRYAFDLGVLDVPFHNDLSFIVTIPVHNEPHLLDLLNALNRADSSFPVLVILVFNCSEAASPDLKSSINRDFEVFENWMQRKTEVNQQLAFKGLLFDSLPKKHAGVGLARKIAMDLASAILEYGEKNHGLITGLDADCTVSENYFEEIHNYFRLNLRKNAASIYFEHPIKGAKLASTQVEAIVTYELYLRYHVNALSLHQIPWGYQTVGSSMVTRAAAYRNMGGMNKRKAAEDFYFLTKYMDGNSFGEIRSCKVFPSARVSDRVPFGTGKAVDEIQQANGLYTFYPLSAYESLGKIYNNLEKWYERKNWSQENLGESQSKRDFWKREALDRKWDACIGQTKGFDTFRAKFLQAFSPLKALQFLKNCQVETNPVTFENSSKALLLKLDLESFQNTKVDQFSLLMAFRSFDQRSFIGDQIGL